MEANEYDTNRVDSDVLLPPRKRLLAGLKRQSSESASQSSPESYSPAPMSEYDLRLQNLLKFYKSGSRMSPEEIAKAAGTAAVAAAKAAEAARAVAEEKAVIAARAVAAAKDALSLVASKGLSGSREGQLKKNKLKKHVPVQHLYKEQPMGEKGRTDEELAQKLHRAINSSPRISRHSPGSKNKHKKHKPSLENNGFANVVAGDGKLASPDDMDSEGSYEESYVAKVVSGEGESSHSKEKVIEPSDAMHSNGRKRGRMKQKKLSLSLCSSKDRANPKDELNQNSSDPTRAAREKKSSTGNTTPSSVEPRANTPVSIEPAPTWKCQDFKVPQCIKPNKVVQS